MVEAVGGHAQDVAATQDLADLVVTGSGALELPRSDFSSKDFTVLML